MFTNRIVATLVIFALFLSACGEEIIPSPKPRAYPRIKYPEKAYLKLDKDFCDFTFQYPAYAKIQQDTTYFDEKPIHPCWFDIYVKQFDCRIHCSYYPIGADNKSFEDLKKDAFDLVDWHNKRANYIDEMRIDKGNDVEGMAFSIEGPAASPFQFFLTDKKEHFFRGALYFNTQINTDSLQPVYKFIKDDIFKMMETFEWTE